MSYLAEGLQRIIGVPSSHQNSKFFPTIDMTLSDSFVLNKLRKLISRLMYDFTKPSCLSKFHEQFGFELQIPSAHLVIMTILFVHPGVKLHYSVWVASLLHLNSKWQPTKMAKLGSLATLKVGTQPTNNLISKSQMLRDKVEKLK